LLETLLVGTRTAAAAAAIKSPSDQQATEKCKRSNRHADSHCSFAIGRQLAFLEASPPSRLAPFIAGLTAGLLVVGACGGNRHALGDPPRRVANDELLSAADRHSFARLEKQLGGRIGVRVSGVGRAPKMERLGRLQGGVAWSSIKVPIALAVIRRGGARRNTELLRRAITASDNQAAEQLWSSLGPPSKAGRAVERALAAAGDSMTTVQTMRVRAGFTSFGQTRWPLTSQQRFIAGLPCLHASDQILRLMGNVIASQRWGLGSSNLPARFKGGWGPDPSGRYLVRQMGLLELPSGRSVAVSVAIVPADGRFDSGTRSLTRIARWLVEHLNKGAVPARRC
jgi:hypothetical protein